MAMVDYIFELENGVNGESFLRVGAGVFSGNLGSEHVLNKVGFTFEGEVRDTVWKNGELRGCRTFGYLRRDWESFRVRRSNRETFSY
jgi:RimJ/RimL family protein N-acetyltransferase